MDYNIHVLKILPEYYEPVSEGIKKFEIRKNDRDFKVRDYIVLREWDGKRYTGKYYTGRISYILDDPDYVKDGYVVFSFYKVSWIGLPFPVMSALNERHD